MGVCTEQVALALAEKDKRIEELEVLNRRLTERWEGAKLRYAEDSQHIAELKAKHERLVTAHQYAVRKVEEAQAERTALEDRVREKRKAGWEGFRNVMYGWCVPLNQINEFFDELLGDEDRFVQDIATGWAEDE